MSNNDSPQDLERSIISSQEGQTNNDQSNWSTQHAHGVFHGQQQGPFERHNNQPATYCFPPGPLNSTQASQFAQQLQQHNLLPPWMMAQMRMPMMTQQMFSEFTPIDPHLQLQAPNQQLKIGQSTPAFPHRPPFGGSLPQQNSQQGGLRIPDSQPDLLGHSTPEGVANGSHSPHGATETSLVDEPGPPRVTWPAGQPYTGNFFSNNPAYSAGSFQGLQYPVAMSFPAQAFSAGNNNTVIDADSEAEESTSAGQTPSTRPRPAVRITGTARESRAAGKTAAAKGKEKSNRQSKKRAARGASVPAANKRRRVAPARKVTAAAAAAAAEQGAQPAQKAGDETDADADGEDQEPGLKLERGQTPPTDAGEDRSARPDRKPAKPPRKQNRNDPNLRRSCDVCWQARRRCSFSKQIQEGHPDPYNEGRMCDQCAEDIAQGRTTEDDKPCRTDRVDKKRGPPSGWANAPRLLELLRRDDEQLLYRWCSSMLLRSHLVPSGFRGSNFDYLVSDAATDVGKAWSESALSGALVSKAKHQLPDTTTASSPGRETVMTPGPDRRDRARYRLATHLIDNRVRAANGNHAETRRQERAIEDQIVAEFQKLAVTNSKMPPHLLPPTPTTPAVMMMPPPPPGRKSKPTSSTSPYAHPLPSPPSFYPLAQSSTTAKILSNMLATQPVDAAAVASTGTLREVLDLQQEPVSSSTSMPGSAVVVVVGVAGAVDEEDIYDVEDIRDRRRPSSSSPFPSSTASTRNAAAAAAQTGTGDNEASHGKDEADHRRNSKEQAPSAPPSSSESSSSSPSSPPHSSPPGVKINAGNSFLFTEEEISRQQANHDGDGAAAIITSALASTDSDTVPGTPAAPGHAGGMENTSDDTHQQDTNDQDPTSNNSDDDDTDAAGITVNTNTENNASPSANEAPPTTTTSATSATRRTSVGPRAGGASNAINTASNDLAWLEYVNLEGGGNDDAHHQHHHHHHHR